MLKQLPSYLQSLSDVGAAIRALNKIDVDIVGVNYGNITAYQEAIKGLSAEQAVAALSSKKLTAQQIQEIMTTESAVLATNTYTEADIQAALAKNGLATSTSALTAAQQAEIVNSGMLTTEKLAEVAATLGLETAEDGSLVSKKALNLEMVKQQLTGIGVVGVQQEQILTMLGLTAAEGTAVGATNLLTGAFNALKASMAAHPIGWIIAGVALLVTGLVALKQHIDKTKEAEREAVTQAHEDAKTALQNSRSELQNAQSSLESIRGELTAINDQIKDIAKKGTIDFVDQEQITNLAKSKQLLEEQNRILQNNEKMKARQAASDAKSLLDTKVENEYYLPRAGSTKGTYTYKQTAEEQAKSLNDIYNVYREYLALNTYEANKYLPKIQEQTQLQKDAITNTVTELYDIVSSFKYADGTVIEGYEDLYDEYMGYINNLQSMTDPDMFLQVIQKIDKKVSDVDLQSVYTQLINDAYNGNFDISKVDDKFLKALEAEGIDKSTIETIFKNKQTEYQRILSDVSQAFNYEALAKKQKELVINPDTLKTEERNPRYFYDGREVTEKEAQEVYARLKAIRDNLEQYAKENPIDFQIIAAYDDDNFNKLKGYIDENFKETGDYATATRKAIQDLKNEMASSDSDTIKSFLIDADVIKSQIDGLKESVDEIASAYDDLKSIIEDYNENGNLTLDNLESLIDLGDDYIGTLFNENGELELNKDSYIALAKAKLEDIRYSMLEKAISQINSLSKNDETSANQSLAESTGNLTEATLKLVAAQKLAEGVDASKIHSIMQTYYQWDALIDNVVSGLEQNTDVTMGVSDATDEATDSTNAYKDALENEKDALEDAKDALESQKDALEDMKDGYEDAISSIKDLIDWVQDYIKQIKNDEIDALQKKKDVVDELIDAQKELLDAEKAEHDWNKTVKEKQNNIASNALSEAITSLDDSSAGRKAHKEATENLSKSREDWIDTLYDHRIDERKNSLDNLKEEQDEYYDNLIQEIQDYLNDEVRLYKDACSMIDNDSGDLYGKLLWYCRNYTTTTEAEFNHMWNSAKFAMEQYNIANLGTFGLLNNLQGRIYDVDNAISAVEQSISEYESAISGVQRQIDNLGDTAENTIKKINDLTAKKANLGSTDGNWYVWYRNRKFSSFFDNKNDAINDLKRQVTQSVPFNELNPLLINDSTVKHYASGTNYAAGGLSLVGERGAEFKVLNTGDGIVKNQIVKGITALGTNPAQFIADAGKLLMKNLFGGALSRSVEAIRSNNQIAPSIHINVQGDATQATVKAIAAVANDIVNKATKNVMNLAVRNKRII